MKKITFALALLIMPWTSFAMDLSLNDAISKITAESQDLKKANFAVKKAQAGLDAANANRWFNLEASASYMNLVNVQDPSKPLGGDLPPELGGLISSMTGSTKFEVPDNIFMAGATLTQPLYTFGKIGRAVDSMRSAIKMSEAGKEMTAREVKYSAAQIYWTAKMTDEFVKISQKSLDATLAAKRNLGAAGRASRANLIKIEADIANQEINLSDAKFNRDSAFRMLKILAGIDENEDINLIDEFPKSFGPLNAGKIENNPEWDMLNEKIRMSEKNAGAKRAGGYPTLAAMASYNWIQMGNDFSGMWDSDSTQSAYWGLSFSVPIFEGSMYKAQATVERMEAESARQDLDKSKKLKTEEYNTAVRKYEHLRGNLANLENARNLAEKAYGISRDRFAAGQTSAIELADVNASVAQLDMALVNAKFNIIMAEESVLKLNGQ